MVKSYKRNVNSKICFNPEYIALAVMLIAAFCYFYTSRGKGKGVFATSSKKETSYYPDYHCGNKKILETTFDQEDPSKSPLVYGPVDDCRNTHPNKEMWDEMCKSLNYYQKEDDEYWVYWVKPEDDSWNTWAKYKRGPTKKRTPYGCTWDEPRG